MSKVTVNSQSIGFPSLLTLLFIGLKLTDKIDWSWVWVLAPTWIPVAIGLGLLAFAGVMFLVAAALK